MGNVVQTVTATTDSSEIQELNGKNNQRVYDPNANDVMHKILEELQSINKQLIFINGGEKHDSD